MRHANQGKPLNAKLRGQGRGGSQRQGQQVEIKKMKGRRGPRSTLVPALKNTKGPLWRWEQGQRRGSDDMVM